MVSSMTLIDFPISKADVVSKGIRHLASREARARFDAIKKHHKTFREADGTNVFLLNQKSVRKWAMAMFSKTQNKPTFIT